MSRDHNSEDIGTVNIRSSDIRVNGDPYSVEPFTPDSPMAENVSDMDGEILATHVYTSSDSNLRRVAEFHETFGHPIADVPNLADEDLNRLRLRLIREEVDELEDAMWTADPVAALDALTDIQYVLDGAFVALGFAKYKEVAAAEVHRSNMSKADENGKAIVDEGGKVMKGPNYSPPDLARILSTTEYTEGTEGTE